MTLRSVYIRTGENENNLNIDCGYRVKKNVLKLYLNAKKKIKPQL